MRRFVSTCLIVLSASGSVLTAHAAPPAHLEGQSLMTQVVTTHRSDGAIFPAVSQTARRQRQRRVFVNGSRRALPKHGSWRMLVEAPSGGDFVAPAGSNFDQLNKDGVVLWLRAPPTQLIGEPKPN